MPDPENGPPAVQTLEGSRGAQRIAPSTDGRYVTLEYRFPTRPPLTVRLDREGEAPPASGVGFATRPDGRGRALWVSVSSKGEPEAIRWLPGGETLPVDVAPTLTAIRRLPGDRALLIHGGQAARLQTIDHRGAVDARWSAGDGAVMTGAVVGQAVCVTVEAASGARRSISLIALEPKTLAERWRVDDVGEGRRLPYPILTIDRGGRRVLLSADGDPWFRAFESESGQPLGRIRSAVGAAERRTVHTIDAESSWFVVPRSTPGGSVGRDWQLLEVGPEESRVILDRAGALAPSAAARLGDGLLVAPFGHAIGADGALRPTVRGYLEAAQPTADAPGTRSPGK